MPINSPKFIVIHCTDTSYKEQYNQFKSVNLYHKSKNFPLSSLGFNGGYHRIYTGGERYIYREDWEEGAHCNQVVDGISMNLQSLGFCVGFKGDIEMMPKIEENLLREDVLKAMEIYNIPIERVKFHRDYATWKTCPGTLYTRDWITNYLCVQPKYPIEVEEKKKFKIWFDFFKNLFRNVK